MPSSSKQWWKVSRQLLNRKTKASTIPSLKNGAGTWINNPVEKANLLAQTFQSKCVLPPEPDSVEEYTAHNIRMPEFCLIRRRWALKIIKQLKDGKASGPDGLPVRFYKECANSLSIVVTLLTRYLLRHRRWPDAWRKHRIHPLHKKQAVSNPAHYRGVHLTDIISKLVERCVAHVVTPYFDRVGAFGIDQWAFRKKRSCRDLVTLLICKWLWAMDQGFKVAIYLSDISGAFDKVDRQRMVKRLREIGLSESMVEFLIDYLAPRSAVVVVQGHESMVFVISDQIFQGTVLGPPLWNVFFEPIDSAVLSQKFKVAKFADDLTAYRYFKRSTPNDVILDDLKACQVATHNWGVQTRVSFDTSKEYFCILDRQDPFGDVFKLLGVLIDPKLSMAQEVQRIRKKASPKIKAILANRHFFDVKGLMHQYKAHALSQLEFSAGAIYHAADTHLDVLDKLQHGFLREIGLTIEQAFLDHNLAPLRLRRDIAVMGLLHKIQLGEAHADFSLLFQQDVYERAAFTRHNARRHRRQFRETWGNTDYYNRSIFSAVRVYNVLSADIVEAKCVKSFQTLLTKQARIACEANQPGWDRMFCAH